MLIRSFANTIFTLHSHPQLATHLPGLVVDEEVSMGRTPVSPATSMRSEPFTLTPDGTRSFCKQTVVLTVERHSLSASKDSTKRFSRHPAKPAQSLHPITIIDTPGLPDRAIDNRDRAVRGLERLIEDRMAEKLKQERSIRRLTRKSGLDNDGLIHLGEPPKTVVGHRTTSSSFVFDDSALYDRSLIDPHRTQIGLSSTYI